MTTTLPTTPMPFRFDETLVEREGAHGYDMGRSPSQHAYAEGTRLAKAWERGWVKQKAAFERKAHY